MKKIEFLLFFGALFGTLLTGCSSEKESAGAMNNGTTEAAHVTEDVTTEEQEVTTEKTEFGKQRLEAVPDRPASDKTQTETVSEEESDEAELDGEGETSVSKKSDDWKTAYVDYLEHVSDTEGQQGYTLIYLDNDDIPELVEVGKSEASGVRIVNYSNGSVHVNGLNRLYFTYIEGKNLLCNSDGLMDSYYDYIYSIVDGELTLVAQGHYGAKDETGLRFDKNGMPIYTYDWNGEDVSEDEYNADFAQVYDSSAATEGYDTDKLESIKEVIDDIETK